MASSNSARVTVPISILKALDESIRLRTVYGLCVQGSAPTGADEVADSRHRYFISVLQNVRQLLGQPPLAAGPSISAGPVPNNGYSAMNLGDQPGEQQLEVDLQERQQFLDSIGTFKISASAQPCKMFVSNSSLDCR